MYEYFTHFNKIVGKTHLNTLVKTLLRDLLTKKVNYLLFCALYRLLYHTMPHGVKIVTPQTQIS